MDDKLFLQRLSEVAEWHRPQTGPNGAASVNKRAKNAPQHPGPVTELELDAMTDQEAQDYYDQLMAWRSVQPNNSVPPEIIKLKTQAMDCGDCGLHCPDGRRVESKLCYTGTKHWRTKCQVCEFYMDPATGQFTLDPKDVHRYMSSYHRPKLGVYNSKHQTTPNLANHVRTQLKNMVKYETEDSILYIREPISPREK
jgi:hypothetical protein